ncbi:hypothetical protein BDY19DRAFT_1091876 [Irpex rosettiformis]|uniref:Uncharacterized protein n=1 Tax=Irpex rosettiformis TaxID=378272 RepID=A0ACB8TZ80_9APHY|nr:hypothetical protein BDY19DRAFT_1091876 [Irpex rosettiformis]
MAKTTTEKSTKTKLISAVKSKAPASKPKTQKSKAPEETVASSKKTEGKRKIVADISAEEDAALAKKSKKTAKPAAGDSEDTVQAVKGIKEVKKGSKSEKVHSKAETKGKKIAVEEEDEEVQSSKPKRSHKSTTKSQKIPSSKKAPLVTDSDEEENTQPTDGNEGDSDEQDVHLFGFSTDDADSSDEEMNAEPDPIEVTKLPTITKDDAVVKQKLEKAKKKPTADRGVIYLGRIPHGFYETQMKSYFSQFGDVTRLRLSRNKKTGRSKHYAFIEFDSSSVAQIVAETMDNYLLMGHILTCKVIPKDEVHSELWIGANRKWRPIPTARVARVKHNKERTEEQREKVEKRLMERQAQKKRKLEEADIKYNFDAVAYKKKTKSVD